MGNSFWRVFKFSYLWSILTKEGKECYTANDLQLDVTQSWHQKRIFWRIDITQSRKECKLIDENKTYRWSRGKQTSETKHWSVVKIIKIRNMKVWQNSASLHHPILNSSQKETLTKCSSFGFNMHFFMHFSIVSREENPTFFIKFELI